MANGKMDSFYGPVKPQFEADGEDGEGAPRKRKVKNRILHLTELMPNASFQLVAQYGTSDQPIYVMEIDIHGRTFQGIGPSKKRAKAMCADYALVHLGVIEKVDETPPDVMEDVEGPDDFTADITDQSTQLYYDFNLPESEQVADPPRADFYADDDDDDDFINEIDDVTLQLLGKNPLTIMGELRPDAVYTLLDETGDPLHPKFLMSVTLDEETFQGSGPSKKLAKGRAARDALRRFFSLEFGTSENGMPIFEGDARIWQHFKAKLECKAQERLDMTRDPVIVLQEYFPQIRYCHREPVERDGVMQYTTIVNIFDEVYEGVGSSKKDSKAVAAANTLDALRRNGVLAAKEREVEADRKAASQQPRIPSLFESDKKSVPVQRNAVAKLNLLYPNLEYQLMAEKPVRNTLLTAFVMAVEVEGRSFAGVGKTKKAAKVDAAEKALRYLRMWTREDEEAKEMTLAEDSDPVASISMHREKQEAKKARMMQGSWSGGPEGNFWGAPPGPDQNMGWRSETGEWGDNQMGWNEAPGGWGTPFGGGPQWGNRGGGNGSNFMGGNGGGVGSFNEMPDMGRGFGGDRGNFGGRGRPFGNQGRGMGPRGGFDGGYGPRGGGGNMEPRGTFFGEGMQGDGQRFRGPGAFSGPRGGFGAPDVSGKGGAGRGGMRMPVGGNDGSTTANSGMGQQKRFPSSPSFEGVGAAFGIGAYGGSAFGGNQVRPPSQPGIMNQTSVDTSKGVGRGSFKSQGDGSSVGNFRPGNPRTPTATVKPPLLPGVVQNPSGKPLGAAGISNSPARGILKSASAGTFQFGMGPDNYQYGMTGSATGSNKAADISGSYQSNLGTNRMYYPSEGYQSTGTAMTGYQQPQQQQPQQQQQQQMTNLQSGNSMNYPASSYPTATTVAASGYAGTSFPTSVGTSYSDASYMTGSTYGAGYYGGYSGTMGSAVQGYGYEYMAGYQVPAATTDPNYSMSNYGAQQGTVNSGYYAAGYDYSQTGVANAGTMDSYGTGAAGSTTMKTTW